MTTFILAGRYFEMRAKRRAGVGAAGAAGPGRQGRRGARAATAPRCGSRSHSSWSATASWCVPARRSPPTASSRRARSAVDASMLTGESVPVEVGVGDAVVGATVNAGGRLVVRATRVGADTQLAQMARLVEDAQNGKAQVQRLADRISGIFVPVVIALSLGDARVLAAGRRRRVGRVHRRGRGADHRLPVRAGPGHADRADGRHRPRRPARHPDQGSRGARVHPRRRHDRARQDRHRDHRPDGAGRRASPPTARTPPRCCGWPAPSRTPRSTRSPGRSPRPPGRRGALPAAEDFANLEGLGVQGVVDGHAVARRPARSCSRSGRSTCRPSSTQALDDAPGPPAAPRSRSAGTAPRAACSSSPTS